MERTYTVKDKSGLHARPASLLTQVAGTYDNDIQITYKQKKMTLKSIMAVMSLGVPHGESFVISVDGDDALEIFEKLEQVLIDNEVI